MINTEEIPTAQERFILITTGLIADLVVEKDIISIIEYMTREHAFLYLDEFKDIGISSPNNIDIYYCFSLAPKIYKSCLVEWICKFYNEE